MKTIVLFQFFKVRGDWDRYPLYCDFFQEIRDWEFHEEKFLQSGKKKREGDVKVKNVKGGEEKEEAKLDSKKHRRVSRRSVSATSHAIQM